MKKIIFISLLLVLCNIVFSYGGLLAGYENIQIHVLHEDDMQFTVQELGSLYFSPTGEVCVLGEQSGNSSDKTKEEYVAVNYYIGSARSQAKFDKLYESQMENFSFTISDPSGTYETYNMDMLADKYTKIEYGVKYTVKLKKKA
ncbi:MAG: hypothetical protein J6I73_07460 [Treponema sp.]|nr:hypothetical protein [Treponema sp.]